MTCMASSSNDFCLLCCILIDWCIASISHNIQSNLLYTRFSEVVNCYKDIAINMKSFMIKYNENINFYIGYLAVTMITLKATHFPIIFFFQLCVIFVFFFIFNTFYLALLKTDCKTSKMPSI